jgi:hypothetical protein
MRSAWLLALAASGCRSLLGIEDPARGDAGPDGFAACATWHPEGFDPCALTIAAASLSLDGPAYVYNSAVGALYDASQQTVLQSGQTIMQADGAMVAVLSIGRLTVTPAARLQIVGPRPLLIVSWSSIVVDGTIDAGSHLEVTNPQAHIVQLVLGAGANQGCGVEVGQDGLDATATGGSGGGGGGGFHGAGGPGGRGGGASGVPGGTGGQPGALAGMRGGCPGGASGAGMIATPPTQGSRALGGAGGGAIRLVAYDTIGVRGTISANGSGGAGAPTNSACGGGGGGSGGYIGFEAPIVALGGTITANGGGGGGGGGASGAGNDGGDGVAGTAPAPGGPIAASGCGQAGGVGGAAATLDGTAAANADTCGGGGGGGGASGFIEITSPDYIAGAGTMSPAAQVR